MPSDSAGTSRDTAHVAGPRFTEALVAAARALTARLDVDAVCTATLEFVERVFDARSSWVLFADPRTNTLRTARFRGPASAAYQDLVIPSDAGIMGLALHSRQVVFVAEAGQEDRWFDPARVQASGLHSVFAVPLLHHDVAIGVLGLDSPRFDDGRVPDAGDIACLEAFAAQAAIAIANARLYQASEDDRRRLRALLQERRRLRGQVSHLEQEIRAAYSFGDIVGDSASWRDITRLVELVAPSDATVLLVGETGTGKELIAHIVHQRSERASRAFVAVNCAALPEALVESELFGHEKGAFTGAIARKPGKFEIADGGTLFLDEISDLPPPAQAKLLRILQDGELQRVGGTRAVSVDVRVIAATNQDLETAVADKRFRADLYYRLSVFPIRLPPLRERPQDVPALAQHFVRVFAARLRKPVVDLDARTMLRLQDYPWPGNVRELQNVLERAVILSNGPTITPELIHLRDSAGLLTEPDAPAQVTSLADAERDAILRALDKSHWRISGRGGAADLLDLKPTTLHAKMKRLGIQRPRRP